MGFRSAPADVRSRPVACAFSWGRLSRVEPLEAEPFDYYTCGRHVGVVSGKRKSLRVNVVPDGICAVVK
ncbi:hypothetical protein ACLOJK_039448 [Asimina triloba]